MQKQTKHIFHRHGIGNMKHIDVAHLWLQDQAKSNRLKVRRVKSEDNLADIGTKARSNKIIRKACDIHGYVDAQENLKSEMLWSSGLANESKQIRAVQFSRKTSLDSTGGNARQQQQQQQRLRGQPSLAVKAAQWCRRCERQRYNCLRSLCRFFWPWTLAT